jgi:hypothetical protein
MEDEGIAVLFIAAILMIDRVSKIQSEASRQSEVNMALDTAAALVNEAKRRSPELNG